MSLDLTPPLRVAIIGGGSAGLACAHYLSGRVRVRLYEKAARLGGHVHAVTVPVGGREVAVETGFLAFHRSHYPQLVALFDKLGVETAPSGVGLGIWDETAGWVFDNTQWFALFGERLPLAGRRHFAELVATCFRHARKPDAGVIPNIRLDEFLAARGYDEGLARYILWPSISALWGFQPAEIMAMSAVAVAESLNRFFITAHEEPFERIVPSTDAWLAKLGEANDASFELDTDVLGVKETPHCVEVRTVNGTEGFDAVILATHADRALGLLDTPTPLQRELLGAFPYNRSTSVVHTDATVLPADPATWTEYNYRARELDGTTHTTTTWHMSRIQGLATSEPVWVTVGPRERAAWPAIAPAQVLARIDYSHPASPPSAVAARPALQALGTAGPIYFCGSYFGTTGSNECAVASAARTCEALLAKVSG